MSDIFPKTFPWNRSLAQKINLIVIQSYAQHSNSPITVIHASSLKWMHDKRTPKGVWGEATLNIKIINHTSNASSLWQILLVHVPACLKIPDSYFTIIWCRKKVEKLCVGMKTN